MKTVFRVLFHLLSYPVLIALVLWADLEIIKDQYKNYSYFTLIGVAVPVVMMLIFYVVYLIVTRKKSKKSKLCQTVIVCMIPILTLGGMWVACDRYLPDVISDATSGTIYYEDLAENSWKERADVNASLLNDFIKMSVMAKILPTPDGMDEKEATEYYQSISVDAEIPELEDNEYYHTINELIAIQYQSINANGYASFSDPWIGFATGSRMTIPCLLHLLLDKRTVDPDDIDKLDSPTVTYHEDEEGNIVIDEVLLAVYDENTYGITLKPLSWTVLDMLGENQEFSLGSGLKGALVDGVGGMVEEDYREDFTELVLGLVDDIVESVPMTLTLLVADERVLGSEVYVDFDFDSGNLALVPADTEQGIVMSRQSKELQGRAALDYMKMAWLNSNGLLYAIVMLLSVRTWFIYASAWIALMMLLDGCMRGMFADEAKRKADLYFQASKQPKARRYNKKSVPVATNFMETKEQKKLNNMQDALVRAIKESGGLNKSDDLI